MLPFAALWMLWRHLVLWERGYLMLLIMLRSKQFLMVRYFYLYRVIDGCTCASWTFSIWVASYNVSLGFKIVSLEVYLYGDRCIWELRYTLFLLCSNTCLMSCWIANCLAIDKNHFFIMWSDKNLLSGSFW